MWDSLDDPNKRREIRYGNNIYVLFRALLHCRKFYGQDSLWVAISRGFNTSATIVKVTAEILTEARRAQRAKPSREIPDTARAADDWIDFLDSQGSYPRVLSDPEVHSIADAFFKTQEKKYVNAAKVPVTGRLPPLYDPRFDMPARPSGLPSPSTKGESPRETDRQWPPQFGRKRSASPPAVSSSKSRRLDHDPRRQHRPEPDRHGALDELPKIQPTRSPPRPSAPRPAQPSQPTAPTQPRSAGPTRGGERSNNSAAPAREPLPPKPSVTLPPKPSVAVQREAAPSAPAHTLPSPPPVVAHDDSALKARIASLEKQLAEAEAKSKLSAAPANPAPATAVSSSQLGKDMVELKKEMATATGAISTMMESMHYIVDNLSSVQEEISGFATEQQTLKAALPQLSNGTTTTTTPNLDALLTPLQTLITAVNTLQQDVTHLKSHPPTPPPAQPQPDTTTTRHLEALLKAQTARLDKLSHQLATIQHHQQRETTPHQPQGTQQPQTLRQAMAAAERDLQHHLNKVQAFYHRSSSVGSGGGGSISSSGAGGSSRAAVERTADLLAVLADGVRAAQAGQAGV
ncbi:hypothetical protein F5144DRAFT_595456 [Chaetomium tenue]|uniref:Uncharacterized protein n=1 Tax=Chaetomium tenue TaxID=1854479 RepID=A0ACB7NYB4_9PEZI|nr:hypothetical protein F5144DRAFT_595456 [Chaetomium globosum]